MSNNPNILIVDCNPDTADTVEGFLKVDGLGTVRIALAAVSEHSSRAEIAAVIFVLSNSNDAAVQTAIQSCSPTPVFIVAPAENCDITSVLAHSLGAVEYLTTPVRPVTLFAKLSIFIRLHRRYTDLVASERQSAAEQLAEKDARIRLIMENTVHAIIVMNTEGLITEWVGGSEAITGWTAEEVIGKHTQLIFTPSDRLAGRAEAELRQAREAGCADDKRWHMRKDGRLFFADGVVVRLDDAEGNFTGFAKIFRDATVERRAEDERLKVDAERVRLLKEVKASNERFAEIFKQTPAFMCVLRGPNHVFELVNEDYLKLVGQRNPIGQPARAALPEVAGQGFFERLDRVYQSGNSFQGRDMRVFLRREANSALEERVVDLVYIALKDASGAVTGVLVHGVDQTTRHMAELELFQSRERLQKIISQAATGVAETDAAGRLTLVNRKLCNMLGYEEDELLGKNIRDITGPATLPETHKSLGKIASGTPGFIIENQFIAKDGSYVWATSSISALRNKNGENQGMVAVIVDITDKWRSQKALRASEERYRTLFASMDQGFCIIEMIYDETGKAVDYIFLEMNKMFEVHTGLVDAQNKTMRDLVPDHDDIWFETYGRVAITGEPVRFESEAKALNRWYDVYATRLGGNDSNRVAVLFSDITARKRADEELRKSLDRQELIVSIADLLRRLSDPADIYQHTSDSIGRFLQCSRVLYGEYDAESKTITYHSNYLKPGIEELVGAYPASSFGADNFTFLESGRTWISSDLKNDPRTSSADFWPIFEALEIHSAVVVPLSRQGKVIACLFVNDDKPREWEPGDVVLIEDVAERVWTALERTRAEQERKSAEDNLRLADRRKDEFLAMLAHELRNPLAPIAAAADLLQAANLDAGSVKRTSQVIERQVSHMTALVDDLLDVSRVTRGLVTLDTRRVELAPIITAAVEQISPLMSAKGHRLTVELPQEPMIVVGDRHRLIQIVSNLLNNAAKFTPEGGHIQLKAEVSPSSINITVSDNGIGMDPELSVRVFDLFAQAERTSDRSAGGLGLGLALVKHLVELHGGKVWVSSDGSGKGSRFVFSLPTLPQLELQPTRDSPRGEMANSIIDPMWNEPQSAQTDYVVKNMGQDFTLTPSKLDQPRFEQSQNESPSLAIMIVDDNIDAANMLGMLLEAFGHRVIIEHDPHDALKRSAHEKPDVFLLDIGLPGMDGNQLARRLRAQSETANAVLIAVTGYGQPNDRKDTMASGFDHHLVKPVSGEILTALLTNITHCIDG